MSTFCHILKITYLILTKFTVFLWLCGENVTYDIISNLHDINHGNQIFLENANGVALSHEKQNSYPICLFILTNDTSYCAMKQFGWTNNIIDKNICSMLKITFLSNLLNWNIWVSNKSDSTTLQCLLVRVVQITWDVDDHVDMGCLYLLVLGDQHHCGKLHQKSHWCCSMRSHAQLSHPEMWEISLISLE